MADPKRKTSDWIAKNVAKLGSMAMKAFGQDEWYKNDSRPIAAPIPKPTPAKTVRDRDVDESMQAFDLTQTIMVGAGMAPVAVDPEAPEPMSVEAAEPVKFDAAPPPIEQPNLGELRAVPPMKQPEVSLDSPPAKEKGIASEVKSDLDRFDRRTTPPMRPARMKKTKAEKPPKPSNPRKPMPNKLADGKMPRSEQSKSAFSGFRDIEFQEPPQDWEDIAPDQSSREMSLDLSMDEVSNYIEQSTSVIESLSEQLVQVTLRLRFVEEQLERLGSRA